MWEQVPKPRYWRTPSSRAAQLPAGNRSQPASPGPFQGKFSWDPPYQLIHLQVSSSFHAALQLKPPRKNEVVVPGFLLSRFLPITRLSRPNPQSSSAEIQIPPEGTPSHSTTHRGLQRPTAAPRRHPRSSRQNTTQNYSSGHTSTLCSLRYRGTAGAVSLRVHKYNSSSGSHTTAAGLVGKRELMLCSLSQLSQAGEHQHSV